MVTPMAVDFAPEPFGAPILTENHSSMPFSVLHRGVEP
jgi:hypothetical protein